MTGTLIGKSGSYAGFAVPRRARGSWRSSGAAEMGPEGWRVDD